VKRILITQPTCVVDSVDDIASSIDEILCTVVGIILFSFTIYAANGHPGRFQLSKIDPLPGISVLKQRPVGEQDNREERPGTIET
jgi:hypothetical protein